MAAVEEFDDFDPTPYSGGYDINLTYGRPIPPSEKTCYAPNADSSSGVDYARPNFSGSARPSQFGYGMRPDTSEEQSYGYGDEERRDPRPYRGEQTEDYGRSEYSGFGRRPDRSEEESYGYGYEQRRDPKPYREEQAEDYGDRRSEYSQYGRSEEQAYGYERKPYREEQTEDYGGGHGGRTRYGQKKNEDDDSDDDSDGEKKKSYRYRRNDYSDD